MRSLRPLTLVLAFALTAPAGAQAPTLSKFGGAAPGTTTLSLTGTPGSLYILLGATSEVQTPVFTGAVLDIPLSLLPVTINLPGFLGLFDANGEATGTLVLPADTSLYSMTLSLQALQAPLYDAPSNLVRVTPQAPESFRATLEVAPLPTVGGTVSTLPGGRLLVVEASATATQIYDPSLEEWSLGLPIVGGGLFSTATTLNDGRVLVTGGLGLNGAPTAAAGLFHPATGIVTPLALGTPRAGHAATLLGNGLVLVTGGLSAFDLTDIVGTLTAVLNSSELFDPVTDTFIAGPNMLEGRAFHTSSALANGALIAGGLATLPIIGLPTISNTAYAYNSGSNSFGFPSLFSTGRFGHSAVTLADGTVLLVGGLTVDLTTFLQTQNPADLVVGALDDIQRYNGGPFGGFSTVGTLSVARAGAGVAALEDGGALIAGGFELALGGGAFGAAPLAAADRFVLGSGVVALTDLTEPRLAPLCTPLNDGTILVIGGGTAASTVWQP